MASCSNLLSEDQFQCSICLDVFTDPVTIPCGHNFCKACITKYWDNSDLCQCPMCKMTFDKRPDLYVNTFISEMAAQFRKSEPLKAAISPDLHPTKPEVSCDICTGTMHKALKSCLLCLASYCETHLEPHQRVAAWKKDKLMDPVENLEERMCQKHDKLLELFCRKDQTFVCVMCMRTDHKTHGSITLEEAFEQRKIKLGQVMDEMKQMMEERSRKVQEFKLSVETSKADAEREISDSVQVFTALVRSIERSQAELIEVIEEKQKAAKKQAEGLIQDLEQEITELKRRSIELEQLSHIKDHLHLLQIFPSLSIPPYTKDWSEISVHSDLIVGAVRTLVCKLEETLNNEMEKLPGVKLKRIQQYAGDVTLDSDTSHPGLTLSAEATKAVAEMNRCIVATNPLYSQAQLTNQYMAPVCAVPNPGINPYQPAPPSGLFMAAIPQVGPSRTSSGGVVCG